MKHGLFNVICIAVPSLPKSIQVASKGTTTAVIKWDGLNGFFDKMVIESNKQAFP